MGHHRRIAELSEPAAGAVARCAWVTEEALMVWIVFGVFVHAAVMWMLWIEARDQSQQHVDLDPPQTRTQQANKQSLTFWRHTGQK